MEPDAWLKTLYAAMKPGAIVGIIDHVARPSGDTRAMVEKTAPDRSGGGQGRLPAGRLRAGGRKRLLRNPADDHSLLVFDAKIRGKTDRFVLSSGSRA